MNQQFLCRDRASIQYRWVRQPWNLLVHAGVNLQQIFSQLHGRGGLSWILNYFFAKSSKAKGVFCIVFEMFISTKSD
jgi:hypothetical protein